MINGKGRQRVLIVDDTPENIRVLMETLRDEYAIMVATSGEKALQACQANPKPDIMLLDINMPGMDGYEVCSRLKADARTASIPVIFITAKSDASNEQRGLELGALDYVHRPFNPVIVRARVRNHLDLQSHRQHLEVLVAARTAELSMALEAAQAASRAKSTFLATMSHELRTPLNSVIGFTDLIHRKGCGEISSAQEEYLGYVLANARHLLQLINNILDFSKIEAGKMELERCMVDIRSVISGSLLILKEQADRNGIVLREIVDAALPERLWVDGQKIKQILINLLSNAVKFTPLGGEVTLVARAEEKKEISVNSSGNGDIIVNMVLFSIRDCGPGIKPEDKQRIFEPFVQADSSSSRKHEGSGLGLALSKMMVELHGGTIWVESDNPGGGATFSFTLPLLVG